MTLRVPWLAVALLGLALAAGLIAGAQTLGLRLPPCPLKAFTGMPCLGCGSTRCLGSLATGDLAGAFRWHPALAGLACLAPFGALWDLRRAWRGRPYPRLPGSLPWRLAVLAALGLAWGAQMWRGI